MIGLLLVTRQAMLPADDIRRMSIVAAATIAVFSDPVGGKLAHAAVTTRTARCRGVMGCVTTGATGVRGTSLGNRRRMVLVASRTIDLQLAT